MKREKGFTLLELMIVVVIIAIIAGFAMFNYSRYAYRSRRVDGKEMLTRVAAAEERYYSTKNQYTNTLTDLGYNASNLCGAVGCSEKGYYLISSVNGPTGDSQSYTLTAAPQGAQAKDTCGSLTLNNANKKTPLPGANASNGECW